ncbi:MAG TPA: type IV pilus twitching motility protein PilT [Candidatus Eisenbacteria bacterium]|nr:type IV pilus twitching motility protein PilT [Candidatus Eisenbacteria bacterium]
MPPLDIQTLLKATVEAGASDLHISAGMPPMIRLRGEMVRSQAPAQSDEESRAMLYTLMNENQRKDFQARHEIDFAFEVPGLSRFRANIFEQRRGIGGVFRVIATKIRTLEELNTPAVLRNLAMLDRGLVLVTGPTGSGKSTTLAAMIDYVNANRAGHIITIEDPIEFVHESKKCLINQREVGAQTESFSAALRSALREDPDILLVGELRDLETTALAITAAETGHLVFGTLHTNSAAKTIDRLIDIFPADRQAQIRTMVSESLEGVIAQSLLATADGKGRVAALEILVGVPALRNLIREDKTTQIASVMQVGAQHGMQTLDQALKDLVISGKISRELAAERSTNPRLFDGVGPPQAGAGSAPASGPALTGASRSA